MSLCDDDGPVGPLDAYTALSMLAAAIRSTSRSPSQ